MDRRQFLSLASAAALVPAGARAAAPARWISTRQTAPWRDLSAQLQSASGDADIHLDVATTFQTIEGFGGCFNELGAVALSALRDADRATVLDSLFKADAANFTVCRLPIGASDYAVDWYSHDEHDGDFAMAQFSIARDEGRLIPYIQSAQTRQRGLKLWASPWSPPTWMKTNKHYAMAMPGPGQPDNGLHPDQVGHQGQDYFIQDPHYFAAYALYFRKFVDAYRGHGLPIAMVMPQNEFNSAQIFPSCCWTPQGLARFIPYLGKALAGSGSDIFFGTMERPDTSLFETVFNNPSAGPNIKGVGLQWGGKGAAPLLHHDHPDLPIYQTEQECGDGQNDWRYARYVWTLMKHYLNNGASVYDYWNIALPTGGASTWGWKQNSLVSVDMETGAFTYNPEYYLLRHMSQFVRPGARRIAALSWTGYENELAFLNPDGSIVVLIQNDMTKDLPVRLQLGDRVIAANLPADSFNTIVL